MQIKIINKRNRSVIVCEQKDGNVEMADVGPGLPAHDLAHYVVERSLKLYHGFYGNIYHGLTVKQLSQKEVIHGLDIESGVSEITTRALQSLHTGACNREQFIELIAEEFKKFSIGYPLQFTEEQILQMENDYQYLMNQWHQLGEGESMVLQLDIENTD